MSSRSRGGGGGGGSRRCSRRRPLQPQSWPGPLPLKPPNVSDCGAGHDLLPERPAELHNPGTSYGWL